jgi:site-specific recombinase XerC
MHLLENGVNLIYIRDLLGHTSVTTTEIYSKANPEIKRKHIEESSAQLIDVSDYDDTQKNDLLDWLRNNI